MTLILSAHKHDTIFQLSDRLVSYVWPGRDPVPLDIHGNKGVIYKALDGIISIWPRFKACDSPRSRSIRCAAPKVSSCTRDS